MAGAGSRRTSAAARSRWTTEETGADPARLAELIAEAKPDETLLVDDLGGWVTALLDPASQPHDDLATVDGLADAVRACAARLVLVSPEVGLSLVPPTPVGRAFTDALGTTNQALAGACDGVALSWPASRRGSRSRRGRGAGLPPSRVAAATPTRSCPPRRPRPPRRPPVRAAAAVYRRTAAPAVARRGADAAGAGRGDRAGRRDRPPAPTP